MDYNKLILEEQHFQSNGHDFYCCIVQNHRKNQNNKKYMDNITMIVEKK